MTPYHEYMFGNLASDTLYRLLVTAYVQAGTFQYRNTLELRIEDMGPWETQTNSNNGSAIGSGTTGVAAKGNYVKSYLPTKTYSYYGQTAANGRSPFTMRNSGSNLWQSCTYTPDRAFYEGDQYSFAIYNYSQIASDLSGATINSVQLRLSNNVSYYSTGTLAIVGWTSYTGTFGNYFQPGSGTHENVTRFTVGQGATLTQDITASGIGTQFQSGGATGLVFGPSASYNGYTHQQNYGCWCGLDSPSTKWPQLIFQYTK
jgi:hypothetical protein